MIFPSFKLLKEPVKRNQRRMSMATVMKRKNQKKEAFSSMFLIKKSMLGMIILKRIWQPGIKKQI